MPYMVSVIGDRAHSESTVGFWVIEAPDLGVALELAAEGARHCVRTVEVRPFL
ncbi:hypothetical protein [Actinokineospora globicatena]|uniref:hypothetical protein n=1 Tax=Actinokineospora globicatena TaxID=103729 RepID=UPI0020A2CB30|nr:hypothetical protein [Actinokineospora globicatena]GLW78512.1 hypothetical protein Aglo01_29940 [Actinokineospora globicatena]GLW84824.1 hypothetical protein Aglo02_24640 [Actinokineospora globicatena]